ALMGADGPGFVVQVEHRRNRHHIHVGFVVGFERSHVAPIQRFFLVFVHKVVGIDAVVVNHFGQNVFAEIVVGVLVLGVLQENGNEDVGVEEVNSHRGGDFFGIIGRSQLGERGLLFETGHAVVGVNGHYAEAIGFVGIDLYGRERDVGGGIEMLLEHQAVV